MKFAATDWLAQDHDKQNKLRQVAGGARRWPYDPRRSTPRGEEPKLTTNETIHKLRPLRMRRQQ